MMTARIALVALLSTACAATLPGTEGGSGPRMLPASHLELTTSSGEVLGVDRRSPERDLAEGVTVELRADTGNPIVLRLAPGWYLDERGIAYGPRERLTVRGRREVRGGTTLFVVNEVRKDGRWIPLRDAEGNPLWRDRTLER